MGKLVVIEGLDGSGKSTQMQLIQQRLTAESTAFRQIKLPDYEDDSSMLVRMYLGGAFGDRAEDVGAYAASSFYAVDRYASFLRHWGRDYENGTLILADRYTTSNAVHQTCKLPFDEWDAYLDWLYDYEYRLLGLPKPDLVFYLDVPVPVSQQLMSARYCGDESKKDIHEKDITYLERCRQAALYAAERLKWVVISCAQGAALRSPESIFAELMEHLSPIL